MKSARRTMLFVWVSFVLVGLVGLIWMNSLIAKEFRRSFELVTNGQEVLQTIEESVSVLKDIESGQRGFALTGDYSFLEPYSRGIARIRSMVKKLQLLTTDNPSQQERVSGFETLVDERVRLSEEVVWARQDEGMVAALALVTTGRGEAAMNSVRQSANEMKAAEYRLLVARQANVNRSLQRERQFSVLLIAMLIASSGGLLWLQARVRKMEEIVRICAWTNQIHHEGEWVSMEQYLVERFGLKTSHGMSQQAAQKLMDQSIKPQKGRALKVASTHAGRESAQIAAA